MPKAPTVGAAHSTPSIRRADSVSRRQNPRVACRFPHQPGRDSQPARPNAPYDWFPLTSRPSPASITRLLVGRGRGILFAPRANMRIIHGLPTTWLPSTGERGKTSGGGRKHHIPTCPLLTRESRSTLIFPLRAP